MPDFLRTKCPPEAEDHGQTRVLGDHAAPTRTLDYKPDTRQYCSFCEKPTHNDKDCRSLQVAKAAHQRQMKERAAKREADEVTTAANAAFGPPDEQVRNLDYSEAYESEDPD